MPCPCVKANAKFIDYCFFVSWIIFRDKVELSSARLQVHRAQLPTAARVVNAQGFSSLLSFSVGVESATTRTTRGLSL